MASRIDKTYSIVRFCFSPRLLYDHLSCSSCHPLPIYQIPRSRSALSKGSETNLCIRSQARWACVSRRAIVSNSLIVAARSRVRARKTAPKMATNLSRHLITLFVTWTSIFRHFSIPNFERSVLGPIKSHLRDQIFVAQTVNLGKRALRKALDEIYKFNNLLA